MNETHDFSNFMKSMQCDKNVIIIDDCEGNLLFRQRMGPSRTLRIPKDLTIGLAYFIGVILGDGFISRKQYLFGIEKGNKIYLEEVIVPLINDLFMIRPAIRIAKRSWSVRIRSKTLWRFLVEMYGLPSGKRKDVKIPSLIIDSTSDIKSNFLAGILDTDGGKRGKGFGFSSASEELNREVIMLLEEFGINPFTECWFNKRHEKSYYGWKIRNKAGLRKLFETIPFKNQKRQNLLQELTQGCQSGHSPFQEVGAKALAEKAATKMGRA